MGSLQNACKTGFICRLCSDMYKNVVHVYGKIGRQINLEKKIRNHLPVTINAVDPLPKTICIKCFTQLMSTYKLVQQLAEAERRLGRRSRIQRGQSASIKTTPTLPVSDNDQSQYEMDTNAANSPDTETN